MDKHELPDGCASADFVVVKRFFVRKEHSSRVYMRVIRRVWSSGASTLIHQFSWQDSGSCGEAWTDARNDQMHQAADFLAEQIANPRAEP